MGSHVERSVWSTGGLSMPRLIWMGRSLPEWPGAQVALDTKNWIIELALDWHWTLKTGSPLSAPCSSTSVTGLNIQHPQHPPSQSHTAWRQGMETISHKYRCLFLEFKTVFIKKCFYFCWTGRTNPYLTALPSSTPSVRDNWQLFACAALLFSAPSKKTQEEHVHCHSCPEIEFAAENLITESNQGSRLRSDQMWNGLSAEQRCGTAGPLILHFTLHVHPPAKGFVTNGDDINHIERMVGQK